MVRVRVALVFASALHAAAKLRAKVLTMEQLQQIRSTTVFEAQLEQPFFTPAIPRASVPRTMAWLNYGDLGLDLVRQQDPYQEPLLELGERVYLYYFQGATPIADSFVCQAGRECTISAEWDGARWHSAILQQPLATANRTSYLDSRANQVNPWFLDGRMLVCHTFAGPQARSLVLNEAFFASGQVLAHWCGIWRNLCKRAVMSSFVRLDPRYPVGLVGYTTLPFYS